MIFAICSPDTNNEWVVVADGVRVGRFGADVWAAAQFAAALRKEA